MNASKDEFEGLVQVNAYACFLHCKLQMTTVYDDLFIYIIVSRYAILLLWCFLVAFNKIPNANKACCDYETNSVPQW